MEKVLETGIKMKYGKITVDEVKPSQYKNHIDQAQIRQSIETVYPGKRAGNSLSDNFATAEEFNLPEGQVYTSTRVTWVDVPKGWTKEQVEERLAAAAAEGKTPCITRIISNNVEDVLTAEQKNAVATNIRPLDDYRESLLVRDGDGNLLPGTPQYRQNFFKWDYVADTDLRTEKPVNTNAGVGAATNAEADMKV